MRLVSRVMNYVKMAAIERMRRKIERKRTRKINCVCVNSLLLINIGSAPVDRSKKIEFHLIASTLPVVKVVIVNILAQSNMYTIFNQTTVNQQLLYICICIKNIYIEQWREREHWRVSTSKSTLVALISRHKHIQMKNVDDIHSYIYIQREREMYDERSCTPLLEQTCFDENRQTIASLTMLFNYCAKNVFECVHQQGKK